MTTPFISFSLLLLFLHPGYLFSQTADPVLDSLVRHEIKGFEGEVGIYVKHLTSGQEVAIQADSVFPTASIVKIPILVGIFDKLEKGQLKFRQPLLYRDSIRYGGSGIMQFFKDSTMTDLSTSVALMLSYSDNTSSLWNQDLAGGGTGINSLMDSLGYVHTRVNSRTPGREKIWEQYGWGQTTPREIAGMLVAISKGKVISAAASEQMYRLLSNTYYTDYALSQIPPGINVASKQGMVNGSRSEVFLVNSPSGDYVCAIFTRNNADESWEYDNNAWVLARSISSLLWNYFNPDNAYLPPIDYENYLEGLSY